MLTRNPTPRPSPRAQARRAGGFEGVAAASSLHRPTLMNALLTIPTGLRPSAQGCAARATLGRGRQKFLQPQRGCAHPVRARGHNPVGVDYILSGSPRVASQTRQPWADGCRPVGVMLTRNPTPRPSPRAQARRAGSVEEVAAASSLHWPTLMNAPFSIPTGLRPSAQG